MDESGLHREEAMEKRILSLKPSVRVKGGDELRVT